jgi:L-ribulose-5-phosphate 4-epimerase
MSPRAIARLREEVWKANLEFVEAGLVRLSFGNASGLDRDAGLLIIKPSGVPYRDLRPETLVAVGLESSTTPRMRPAPRGSRSAGCRSRS